ncbi:MAG: hypothetical protein ABI682_01130 [Acidobacteriota bacterium]
MPGRPAARLSRALTAVLRPVTEAAEGERLAVVGGVVRDRILRLPLANRDVDVIVEGDAKMLARRVAKSGAGTVKLHERFDTATLLTPEGWSIDLARARREIYRRPGALPEVSPATLEQDLGRRDFTINAMAIELEEGRGGRLHDPFGGAADLDRRLLRVLHDRSFEDDPTRALRAVRYAARLNLRLETRTRRSLDACVSGGALETVSADRLRRELARTLSERRFAEAIRLFDSLGIGRALHPGWRLTPALRAALGRAERLARRARPGEPTWLLPLLVWTGELSEPACRELALRLGLPAYARRELERWPATRHDRLAASGRAAPLSCDERLAAAALLPATGEGRQRKRRLLSPVALSIRGADLLRAGIPPGPRVGRALAETREALGRGTIAPDEELEFALEAARRGGE